MCEERRGKKITYANNVVLTDQWMGKEAVGWVPPSNPGHLLNINTMLFALNS